MEENARKQIEENERQMDSLKKSYEQKLAEALAKVKCALRKMCFKL